MLLPVLQSACSTQLPVGALLGGAADPHCLSKLQLMEYQWGCSAIADCMQSSQTSAVLVPPEHAGVQQAAVSALRPSAGRSDDHCSVPAYEHTS